MKRIKSMLTSLLFGSSRRAFVLVGLVLGLSLGSLCLGGLPAVAQECVTTGGCTGDVAGASMCGTSTTRIETGQFCSLNNCQEPKFLKEPTLEIEAVPVRRRQNPMFRVRLVAEVETPWNIWARTNKILPTRAQEPSCATPNHGS
jgi:hypothetical protein